MIHHKDTRGLHAFVMENYAPPQTQPERRDAFFCALGEIALHYCQYKVLPNLPSTTDARHCFNAVLERAQGHNHKGVMKNFTSWALAQAQDALH
jgi:hypothetical protein